MKFFIIIKILFIIFFLSFFLCISLIDHYIYEYCQHIFFFFFFFILKKSVFKIVKKIFINKSFFKTKKSKI